MIAPARMFSCLLTPNWRILEQSNIAGTSGSMEDLFVTLYLFGDAGALVPAGAPCLAGFAVASAPRARSETPTRATNRPTKRRRLKNADCEVAFFFMIGYGVNDWSLECEASLYLTNQQNVKTFVKNIEKTFGVYPGSSA